VLDCLDDPNTPSRVCLMAGTMTHEVLDAPDLRGYVEKQRAVLAERSTARLTGSTTLVSTLAAAIEGRRCYPARFLVETITAEGERATGVDTSHGHVAADLVIFHRTYTLRRGHDPRFASRVETAL
jgi:hypothetical protein